MQKKARKAKRLPQVSDITAEETVPYKFWAEYSNSDHLARAEKIKHIVKMFLDLERLPKKKGKLAIREHALTTLLMAYFDDLTEIISYYQDKEEARAKKKNKKVRRKKK